MNNKWLFWLLSILFVAGSRILILPEGLTPAAWHLLLVFVVTIIGIIVRPYPTAVVTIISWCYCSIMGLIRPDVIYHGFNQSMVWLVVFAFLIARGIIKTGLGKRIALYFIRYFGKGSLGLGYAVSITDLLLSPAIPSITARGGGILLPVVKSLSESLGSNPKDPTSKRIGSYLFAVAMHSNSVTSAMFLTSMAVNPTISQMGLDILNINVTWLGWAYANFIPGLCIWMLVPLLLWVIEKPTIKLTEEVQHHVTSELNQMGPLKKNEYIMITVFFMVLVLWSIGPWFVDNINQRYGTQIMISAATTALLGMVTLLLTDVLNWNDVLKESGAWQTLMWFSVMLCLSKSMLDSGVIQWVKESVPIDFLENTPYFTLLIVISAAYFYAHYLFASNMAHITALFVVFLGWLVAGGVPPKLAFFCLSGLSSFFGAMTHYASGPAAILSTAGYISIKRWWLIGFVMSTCYFVLWLSIGSIWWKWIGLW
jgi:divalent anion:Na+ symporter, DASS family